MPFYTHNQRRQWQLATGENVFAETPFLPGMTLLDYLVLCHSKFPDLFACLDLERMRSPESINTFKSIHTFKGHFESESKGGRGDAYRSTQLMNPLVRAIGIAKLFDLVRGRKPLSPELLILDVLGGNGTLHRAMRNLKGPEHCPTIFTSDVSADMVADALSRNIPAIRQPAQSLMLRENSVDGVIFAYGTHHIPVNDRPLAVAEAYRILRPNSYIVAQDFETGTPTARWYGEVLHKYTVTGHAFEHFTREGLYDLLTSGGFIDVQVIDVYDPCVVYGATPEQAKINLLSFLVRLFALTKLLPSNGNADRNIWPGIEEIITPYATFQTECLPHDALTVPRITVTKENDQYRAEMPRVALVGVGLKP